MRGGGVHVRVGEPVRQTDVTSLEMALQKTEKKTKPLLCVVF